MIHAASGGLKMRTRLSQIILEDSLLETRIEEGIGVGLGWGGGIANR